MVRHLCAVRWWRIPAVVFVLLLVGCTTVDVRIPDPEIPPSQTKPIPGTAGIYFAPEFRQIDIDQSLFGDSGPAADDEEVDGLVAALMMPPDFQLRTDLGPASVALFESVLRTAFPDAQEVAQAATSADMPIVLAPSLEEFNYRFDYVGNTVASIVYGLTILVHDRPSITLQVEGLYDKPPGGPLELDPIWSGTPRNISEAMRRAGTQLLLMLHDAAKTEDWLGTLEAQATNSGR